MRRSLPVRGQWKYIEPGKGAKIDSATNMELGNDPRPQLYNLANDLDEQHNVATQHLAKVEQLGNLLKKIREQGRTRF